MSLTDRIVRLTIHPVTSSRLSSAIILYAKHFQILGEIGWLARVVYFNDPARAMNASGAGRHGWAPMNSANLYGDGDGGVCVCSRMRARAYAGMCALCVCNIR